MAEQKNPHALIDLIRYEIRARQNGYWLESIALSHLFAETQLRLILRGARPSGKPLKQDEVDNIKSVSNLAKFARDHGLIEHSTWEMIRDFNSARNRAIHELAGGNIFYEELKVTAEVGNKLISNLQRYYATVTIGLEQRNDE